MAYCFTSPFTDKELWNYIWHDAGGIKRSDDYWDSRLTSRENSNRYRHLDRAAGEGRPMDCLGDEIGAGFPWFGITNGDELWEWIQRYEPGKGGSREDGMLR